MVKCMFTTFVKESQADEFASALVGVLELVPEKRVAEDIREPARDPATAADSLLRVAKVQFFVE